VLPLEYGGKAAEVPVELAARQLPGWRQQQSLQLAARHQAEEPASKAAQLRPAEFVPVLANGQHASLQA
jgi:hypothetical protein